MKTLDVETTTLEACLDAARRDGVVLMRGGKAVALVKPLDELDAEQLELCQDPEFWKMIEERRKQPTISRAELERRIDSKQRRRA